MLPVVALARAKRRILLPFLAGLDTIIIAALLWLDARKSPALEYDGESHGAPSHRPADQDPFCDKACAASERHDASRDGDLSDADAGPTPLDDGAKLRPAKPSGADTNASPDAHHGQMTVVKSSAYPQNPAGPLPADAIVDVVTAAPVTGKPAPGSAAAAFAVFPDSSLIEFTTAATSRAAVPQIDTTAPAVPTITSIAQGGPGGNHWALNGTAEPNSIVAIFDGDTQLAAVTASASGSWSYVTTGSVTNSSIRTFSASASDAAGNTSAFLAAWIEGTASGDTFVFASRESLVALGKVNGNGGADAISMTAQVTLGSGDFANVTSVETLQLTGASTVTLGADAASAGIVNIVTGTGTTAITDFNSVALSVDATALADDATLTLAGSTAQTVTGLRGDLAASGVSGALNVTAVAVASGLSIATGSGANTITASALTAGQTLTLTGSSAATATLNAGNLSAGAYTGDLTVTAGTGANTITVGNGTNTITGGGGADILIGGTGSDTFNFASAVNLAAATTIAGGAGNDTIQMTAAATLTDAGFLKASSVETLKLTGASTITLGTNAASTGIVNVVTGTGATSITSSNGVTLNVDAALLANNIVLTLVGSAPKVVTGLIGNITASSLTGALTVTTADATDNTISITTGSAATSITASGASDVVTVNATALADNATLTLAGSAARTVTGLRGDLAASAVSGALNVTTVAVASGLSIATGSGSNTITASALTAGQTLTLTGGSAATATLNAGNLSAGAYTGNLTVTGGTGANTITAGNGTNTITGGGGADILTGGTGSDTFNFASAVNLGAAATIAGGADNDTIQMTAAATLTDAGFLNASSIETLRLTGASTITLGANAAAAGIVNVTTGNGATSITDSNGVTLNVDAAALANNTVLTLVGSAAEVVTGLIGNIAASSLTGTLTVTTGNATDNGIAITTGSAATSITASGAGDVVTVNATALAQNTALTLIGSAAETVTGLVGDIVAGSLTGALTVTTGNAANNGISITTGSAATSITASGTSDIVTVNAAALANNTALTLVGSAAEVVSGLIGNITASSLTGALTVTTGDATDDSIAITTGSAATSITASSAEHRADAGRFGSRDGDGAGREYSGGLPDRCADGDDGRCGRQWHQHHDRLWDDLHHRERHQRCRDGQRDGAGSEHRADAGRFGSQDGDGAGWGYRGRRADRYTDGDDGGCG